MTQQENEHLLNELDAPVVGEGLERLVESLGNDGFLALMDVMEHDHDHSAQQVCNAIRLAARVRLAGNPRRYFRDLVRLMCGPQEAVRATAVVAALTVAESLELDPAEATDLTDAVRSAASLGRLTSDAQFAADQHLTTTDHPVQVPPGAAGAGVRSRRGFGFQDLVLLDRLLGDVIEARAAEIQGTRPPEVVYGVEAQGSPAGPDWDLSRITRLVTGEHQVELEEVKSGRLSKDDRIDLWRRIRRSAQGAARISARLTVNQDAPINHDLWRNLQEQHQEPLPRSLPEGNVTTSAALAREALYHLAVSEPATALSEAAAREILRTFQYDDERTAADITSRVKGKIHRLSHGLGVEVLLKLLRGTVAQRAESLRPAEHEFTAHELISDIEPLRRLCEVDPEHNRLRNELVNGSAAVQGDVLDGLFDHLEYQAWRELQPQVHEVTLNPAAVCVALVGHGGIGKTVLLARMDPVGRAIWLDRSLLGEGTELATLTGALELEAFVAAEQHETVWVLVDALESISERKERRQAILAALRRVAVPEKIRVVVTCRETEWRSLAGIPGKIAGWTEVPLQEWSEDRVACLVQGSGRPEVQPDLLRLLRTPLLLDLFLRTFRSGDEVPGDLKTRHGLLTAYWQRRVLDASDLADTAACRQWLGDAANQEALGTYHHGPGGSARAANALLSEGLLVNQRGQQGWLVFRHALLRDFTIKEWALGRLEPGPVAEPQQTERLEGITRSTVKFGAVQAAVEHLLAPGTRRDVTLGPLVRGPLARLTAEILGELEEPQATPLEEIGQAAAASGGAEIFGSRLLNHAQWSINAGWLGPLADRNDSESWAESAGWVGPDFLLDLASYIEVICRDAAGVIDDGQVQAVALRMREWSGARKFAQRLDEGDGWGWQRLIEVVSPLVPTDQTLDWLDRHVSRSWRTRSAVLRALPLLVVEARRTEADIDLSRTVDLYLAAAGLVDDGHGGLVDDPDKDTYSLLDFHRVETALVGRGTADGGAPGLMDALPHLFLPLVFRLFMGQVHARRAASKENALLSKLVEKGLWGSWEPQPDPEPVARIKESLRERCEPELDPADALGDLIDDVGLEDYWRMDMRDRRGSHGKLVSHLRRRIRESLQAGSDYVVQDYWPAAHESRSALARIILLDLLVSEETVHLHQVVDDLLLDRRLYHCNHALYWLWRAIRARWSDLDEAARSQALGDVASTARSPSFPGMYRVGTMLSAVPEADRPAELRPFLDLYEAQGWRLEPRPPRASRPRAVARPVDPDDHYPEVALEGQSSDCQELWRDAYRWGHRITDQTSPEVLAEAAADFRRVIHSCLPTPEQLNRRIWPLDYWAMLLRKLREAGPEDRPEQDSELLILEAPELRRLFQWALDTAQSRSVEEVNSDRKPIPVQATFDVDSEPWCSAVQLMDELLVTGPIRDEADLRSALFGEVERMGSSPAPRIARAMLVDIRAYNWFREPSSRQLLFRLLCDEITDPGALHWFLDNVGWFPAEQRRQVLARWLTEDGSLPQQGEGLKESLKLVHHLGTYLGSGSLYRSADGEKPWPRPILEEWLTERPAAGLLSTDEGYREWLGGILASSSEMRDPSKANQQWGLPEGAAADHRLILEQCWDRLCQLPPCRDEERASRIGLFVVGSLADEIRDRKKGPEWWSELLPLTTRVLRECSGSDLCDIVFALRDQRVVQALGVAMLEPILAPMAEAVQRVLNAQAESAPGLASWCTTGDLIRYASEVMEHVGRLEDAPSEVVNRILEILNVWSSPPTNSREAGKAMREVRNAARERGTS